MLIRGLFSISTLSLFTLFFCLFRDKMLSVGSFSAVLGKLMKMQIPRSSLQLDKQPGIWSLFFCTDFQVFIEFVTILLLFYVLVSDPEACATLAPQVGVRPAPSAPEDEVSTTKTPREVPWNFCFFTSSPIAFLN